MNFYFSKNHFSVSSHGCPTNNDSNDQIKDENKESKSILEDCHFCKQLVPDTEIVSCSECNNKHCLAHRHPDSHSCSSINKVPEVKKPAIQIQTHSAPANRGAKNDTLAKRVAIMKMKQSAKGFTAIPQTERLHFNLIIPNDSSPKPIFLSKEWSIGKCVDWLATTFKLVNNNSSQDALKLVLSKQDQDNYFSFSSKLNDLITNDFQEGDTIVLKYVES